MYSEVKRLLSGESRKSQLAAIARGIKGWGKVWINFIDNRLGISLG